MLVERRITFLVNPCVCRVKYQNGPDLNEGVCDPLHSEQWLPPKAVAVRAMHVIESNECHKNVDEGRVVFEHIEDHVQIELVQQVVHLTKLDGLSGAFRCALHRHE